MATFNPDAVGLEKTIRQLQGADLLDDTSQERILRAGADVVVDSAKRYATARGHVRTRAMLDNIGISGGLRKSKSGYSYMLVSISGSVSRGAHRKTKTRNAVKGFVLNYGRSAQRNAKKGGRGKITGSRYWSDAVKASSAASIKAMQDEANLILREKGAE